MRIGISGWRYPGWRGTSIPRGCRSAASWSTPPAAQLDRDQRLVLLAAAAVELRGLARGDARRLRVRGQGRPLHHPHEEARATSRRRWRTSSPRACWRSATSSGRSSGSSRRSSASTPSGSAAFFDAAAAHHRAAAAELARAPRRAAARRPRVDRARRATGRCATRWRSAHDELPDGGVRRAAARARHRAGRRRHRGQVAASCEDVTADFMYVRLHGDEELYDERLHRRGARLVGRQDPRAGAASTVGTYSSTSTTTRRSAHPTTR